MVLQKITKILQENISLNDRGKLKDENGICDERLSNFVIWFN